MTGKEWNKYFKGLTQAKRDRIQGALITLKCDPVFKKAYGNDFNELASLIDWPLK